MNSVEAVTLIRLIKAGFPHQKFDEYTADAWEPALSDLRFQDCRQALNTIIGRANFVSPKDIRDEVRRIRDQRLEGMDVIQPPDDLSPWGGYLPWLRATRRAIADGEPAPQPEQVRARDMPALDGVFRRVPDEEGAA